MEYLHCAKGMIFQTLVKAHCWVDRVSTCILTFACSELVQVNVDTSSKHMETSVNNKKGC